MYKNILTEIPFSIEFEELKHLLQLRNNKRIIEKTEVLINYAKLIAKPKAIYIKALIDQIGKDKIIINGISLQSKTLRSNIEHVTTVFPYVITCGTEIEQLSNDLDDVMGKYILDGIKTIILMSTTEYISQHIKDNYGLDDVSYEIPGTIDGWEMKEQKELFHLIGDVTELIGVRLSDSFIMHPGKSVSGIYYETGN